MQTRSTGGRGWRHHSSTFCRDKRLNRLTNKKITFKGIDLSLYWRMQNFILKLTILSYKYRFYVLCTFKSCATFLLYMFYKPHGLHLYAYLCQYIYYYYGYLFMCIHMPKYTVTIFKFNLVCQREIHLVDMTTITDNDEIQLQDH